MKEDKITTSDSLLKYIIPIDLTKGLIMISYTDGRYADYWKEIDDQNELNKRVLLELNRLSPSFKLKLIDIKYIKAHYWKDCVHYWKPGKDSKKVSDEIINPFPGLYISSESYSERQGWIEGSLEQVEKLISCKNLY